MTDFFCCVWFVFLMYVGVEDALFSNDPFNRITLIVKRIPRLYPGSRPVNTQAFGGGRQWHCMWAILDPSQWQIMTQM